MVQAPSGTITQKIRKVTPDGLIHTVAGGEIPFTEFPDGAPALEVALIGTNGLAVGPDGTVYLSHASSNIVTTPPLPDMNNIVRVRPDGLLFRLAGDGESGADGDGGAALQARLGVVQGVAVMPDGSVVFSDQAKVRRIQPALPGLFAGATTLASDDGRELYVFSPAGRILLALSAITGDTILTFGYDQGRRLVSITDRVGQTVTIERNTEGMATAVVSASGERTEITTNGGALGFTGPDQQPIGIGLGTTGLLDTLINKNGVFTAFAYDSVGRVTRINDASGELMQLERAGSTVTISDAVERQAVVGSVVSSGARASNVTVSPGLSAEAAVATDGSFTTTALDGTVTVVTQRPDPLLGIQAPLEDRVVTTPDGVQWSRSTRRGVTYDASSTLVAVAESTIINGRPFVHDYSVTERSGSVNTPGGRSLYYELNDQGLPARDSVPGLAAVVRTYDSTGNLLTVAQGARLWQHQYDSLGRLSEIVDPLGRTQEFAYDVAGRVIELTSPDGRSTAIAYDNQGNVVSRTPPGRPAHTFTYTSDDRISTYIPPNGDSTRFEYNEGGQLARLAASDETDITFTYTDWGAFDRITLTNEWFEFDHDSTTGGILRIRSSAGDTLSYTRDGELVTGIRWTGRVQGELTLNYDPNFQVASDQVTGSAWTSVQYSYDDDLFPDTVGLVTIERIGGNGLVESVAVGDSLRTEYEYDELGQLVNQETAFGGTGLFRAEYARDSLGRVIEIAELLDGNPSTTEFAYDSAGRLASVIRDSILVATYEYDSNSNRTQLAGPGGSVSGTVNQTDQLLAYGETTFSYSAGGRLERRVVAGDTTTYEYDLLGNLLTVTSVGTQSIQYVVDGQGQRVGRIINGDLVHGFLYGPNGELVAVVDSSGEPLSRFVYASRSRIPDYMVTSDSAFRFVTDHLGSVRLVVNLETSEIAQRIDYDEFGRVVNDTRPGFQPFGFAGGLYDAETGLVRFGTRDYDAATGRWTSPDLKMFEGGDDNLYVYSANDPVNRVDRVGEYGYILGAGIGAGLGIVEFLLSSDRSVQNFARSVTIGAVTGAAGVLGGGGTQVFKLVGGPIQRSVSRVVGHLFVTGALAGGTANLALQIMDEETGGVVDPKEVLRASLIGGVTGVLSNVGATAIDNKFFLQLLWSKWFDVLESSVAAVTSLLVELTFRGF